MSRAAPSPGRRKSAGLVDRDMNRFDNNNLTLPVTKGELTLPVTKGERKGKRGVSMGGGSIGGSLQILSETQVLRRQAVSSYNLNQANEAEAKEVDPQDLRRCEPRGGVRAVESNNRLRRNYRLWAAPRPRQRP